MRSWDWNWVATTSSSSVWSRTSALQDSKKKRERNAIKAGYGQLHRRHTFEELLFGLQGLVHVVICHCVSTGCPERGADMMYQTSPQLSPSTLDATGIQSTTRAAASDVNSRQVWRGTSRLSREPPDDDAWVLANRDNLPAGSSGIHLIDKIRISRRRLGDRGSRTYSTLR